jgi:multidrug efflux pump
MSLASLSIKRPVLAIVLSLTIVIFGVISFGMLGVREYPAVDPPIITVSTGYVGANAEVIETQITEPLEASINGIAGIKNLTSVSTEGSSSITVEFDLEVDLERAANDVRDRVSRAQRSLPADTDPPVVTKADANSFPIIFMNVNSTQRSLLELSAYAENVFKERFQTIPGVSQVFVWGSKLYSMRLRMDPDKLAAFDLTPLDVLNAVNRDNVELPTGRIEGLNMELSVRAEGRLNTPQEYNNLIIKEEGDVVVRFQDLGIAELAPRNERTLLRRNGVPMVMVVLSTQPGSNALEISEEFYKRLSLLEKDLPEDLDIVVSFDSTKYINQSIEEVRQTIILAFSLVVLIIFLFLRDWRTTIIPVFTIPISLIGAFSLLYAFGFSINVLTLLAVVLAIGLVVDDTIVVLENIYSKIEEGMDPVTAGLEGTKEIFFAVIATTVALVAVFMPVLFLQGLTGRLFREFGVMIAGAVLISSFVALSLTPMLSSKLLKKRERHNAFYRFTEPFFKNLNKSYNWTLEQFMEVRWVAILIVLLSAGMIYKYYNELPSELSPKEDRNRYQIIASAQEGATFDYMDRYVNKIVDTVMAMVPEQEGIISVTSPSFGNSSTNSAFFFGQLKDPDQREASQNDIVNRISPAVTGNTTARAFVTQPESIGQAGLSSLPIEYVILAPELEDLKEVLPTFVERAKNDPTFTFVNENLKFSKPEINISINRSKARSLGISVRDVAQTLQLAISGQRFGYFIMDGKQYEIIGQVDRIDRNDPLDLTRIYVRNIRGELIQMDNLVEMTENSSPPQLFRHNRFISAKVSANLTPGKTIGDGIEAMDQIAAEVLDERFYTALTGTSQEYTDSSSNLIFAFLFALVLIYLVLSAQFESFIDPLIIMLTVPLAVAGALLSLWLYDQSLNIFSQIGIIMLIGLVTKNGILIVEFANQRKANGVPFMDAIIGAAEARFRPILMTSLSTVLGILPIALALGAGAESRKSMGIAVIGGLIFASLLTLYVIPAIYTYLSRKSSSEAG